MIKILSHAVFFVYLSCTSIQAVAADIINIKNRPSSLDLRGQYIDNLMVRALRISREEYGPFTINRLQVEIPRHESLQALKAGEPINVSLAMTTQEWENQVIPIRIPVRRGIFKYRLLLVHQDNRDQYQTLTNVKQLKQLPVGLMRGWATGSILTKLDFNIVEADSYDSVFEMLHNKQFAYTIRGVHEAYEEIRLRKRFFKDLVVEPNILLHMPAPSYFFVSPKYPRVAQRLEYGLEKMVASGELKKLFEQAFSKYIDTFDLQNRIIIDVGNPLLPEHTPLERDELWFDFKITP